MQIFKLLLIQCLNLTSFFPRPEELYYKLSQGCKFSKIDLPHAYLQIELDDKSKEFVVITTHQALYHYKQLPFGLNCAPAVFQKIVKKVIQRIPGTAKYSDDIIITGATEKEHNFDKFTINFNEWINAKFSKTSYNIWVI